MVGKNRGKDHPFFAGAKNGPEVIAHRGGAGEFPGETIYAFREAVHLKADILEMDIRYTADDELVLMHDRNVVKTTGIDERVKDLKFTSTRFQALDAAYWWKKVGKVFPPGAQPSGLKLGVPRLEDVLKTFSDRRMIIEIKPFHLPIRLIKKFGNLLRHYKMTEKVLVASGSYNNLFFFRRAFPEVATSASVLELAIFRALKGVKYTPDCDALQLSSKAGPLHFITQKYIAKAHELGLIVHGWTVNEPEEMGRLTSLGIDGIITDHPSLLI